jgi:hypothetical protein
MWLRVHAFAVVALAAGSFSALLLSMLFLVFSTIIATIEKSVQNKKYILVSSDDRYKYC